MASRRPGRGSTDQEASLITWFRILCAQISRFPAQETEGHRVVLGEMKYLAVEDLRHLSDPGLGPTSPLIREGLMRTFTLELDRENKRLRLAAISDCCSRKMFEIASSFKDAMLHIRPYVFEFIRCEPADPVGLLSRSVVLEAFRGIHFAHRTTAFL